MPRQSRAAGGGGRAPTKRKLAEEFPAGEVLTDTGRKSWKLGAPVGRGGFGLIYLGNPTAVHLLLLAVMTRVRCLVLVTHGFNTGSRTERVLNTEVNTFSMWWNYS